MRAYLTLKLLDIWLTQELVMKENKPIGCIHIYIHNIASLSSYFQLSLNMGGRSIQVI